jgi:N-acetylglutamate synthase-like GNAT family acetyltransferase
LLQGLGDAVMFATDEDRPAVQALCASYGLAPTEFDESTETMILREPEGEIVGCVSLKVVGQQALLFNLAVARSRRGEGLGWILADGTIRRARNLGVRAIYLTTVDAADFFAGKGRVRGDHGGGGRPGAAQQPALRDRRRRGVHGLRSDVEAEAVTLALFFGIAAVALAAGVLVVAARSPRDRRRGRCGCAWWRAAVRMCR